MILIISKLSSIKFKSWSDWSEFGFEPSEDPDGEVGYLSDNEGLLPETKLKFEKIIKYEKFLTKLRYSEKATKNCPTFHL